MLPTGLADRHSSPTERGKGLRRAVMWSVAAAVALGSLVFAGPDDSTVAAAVETAAQQEGTGEESLIDRLVALEQELPKLPPATVQVDDTLSWAQINGDFAGSKVVLDTVSDEARDLFVDASEAGGPLADAVADASRSLLELDEAYDLLATWETYDVAFPLEGDDDSGVSTGADEVYGVAETGLQMVLDAHLRRLDAYAVLRDTARADQADQELLASLYDAEVAFDRRLRPDLHRALSMDTTEVSHVTDRFVTTAPGVDARARVAQVACLPRGTEDVTGEVTAEQAVPADAQPATDCPDLPAPSEVRPSAR